MREVWNGVRKNYSNQVKELAATRQRTQYYPSGLPWAESFGAAVQKHKYNGKEFVEMHGLDEYDSEARWFYPAIMRTTTIDPLAEKYYSISPYAWCGGNPVKFIDPDGRLLVFAQGSSKDFKDNFNLTNSFLSSRKANAILTQLDVSPVITTIKESSNYSYYSPKSKTLNWNPTMGIITSNGHILSPATVLIHEADHAIQEIMNPVQKKSDKNTSDPNYTNLEEKRVITGSEQETAMKLGEIKEGEVTRTDHSGQSFTTQSPITTTGKDEFTVTAPKKKPDNYVLKSSGN